MAHTKAVANSKKYKDINHVNKAFNRNSHQDRETIFFSTKQNPNINSL